jgi:hypothetical protein
MYRDNQLSFTGRQGALPIVRFSGNAYRAARIGMDIGKRSSKRGYWNCVMRNPLEMRKEIRYRLDVPAVFSWEGRDHRRLQGEGVTRDVSVQGAFILTATMPPDDCPIQVDLLLPSLTGVESMMRITGRARVVRLERPANKWIHGFAVVTCEINQ